MLRLTLFVSLLFSCCSVLAGQNFRDDFDGQLKPGWQWIDPKSDCTMSLEARAGCLRVVIPGGRHDLWLEADNYYAPRLMREASGDFTLETKVGSGRPQGGLLVWKDYRNLVRWERGIHFKNELYFAAAVEGKFIRIAMDYVVAESVWLRLERKGSTYTATYSLDGKKWQAMKRTFTEIKARVAQDREDWRESLKEEDFKFERAKSTAEMNAKDPLQVGIAALSQGYEPRVIDFDYFEMRRP